MGHAGTPQCRDTLRHERDKRGTVERDKSLFLLGCWDDVHWINAYFFIDSFPLPSLAQLSWHAGEGGAAAPFHSLLHARAEEKQASHICSSLVQGLAACKSHAGEKEGSLPSPGSQLGPACKMKHMQIFAGIPQCSAWGFDLGVKKIKLRTLNARSNPCPEVPVVNVNSDSRHNHSNNYKQKLNKTNSLSFFLFFLF